MAQRLSTKEKIGIGLLTVAMTSSLAALRTRNEGVRICYDEWIRGFHQALADSTDSSVTSYMPYEKDRHIKVFRPGEGKKDPSLCPVNTDGGLVRELSYITVGLTGPSKEH